MAKEKEVTHKLGPTGEPVTIRELIDVAEKEAPKVKREVGKLIRKFKDKGLKEGDVITHVEFDISDNIDEDRLRKLLRDEFRAKVTNLNSIKRMLAV